jgi:hypothetical protein
VSVSAMSNRPHTENLTANFVRNVMFFIMLANVGNSSFSNDHSTIQYPKPSFIFPSATVRLPTFDD